MSEKKIDLEGASISRLPRMPAISDIKPDVALGQPIPQLQPMRALSPQQPQKQHQEQERKKIAEQEKSK